MIPSDRFENRSAGVFGLVNDIEEMNHTEVIKKIRDSSIRVEQIQLQFLAIDPCLSSVGITQCKACKHTEKCAVHGNALSQVQDEMAYPLAAQFINERLKINARREIRPTRKFDEGHLFNDRNGHDWRFARHSFCFVLPSAPAHAACATEVP
jgi:hypothetical protein